jgi:hypothetical protein
MASLHQVFEQTCPITSPNATYCDFYLCGNLKGKAYKNNPHTTKALQDKATNVMASVPKDELQNVMQDLFVSCETCLKTSRRGSFPTVSQNMVTAHFHLS